MRKYEDSGYSVQEFDSFSEVAQFLEQTPDLYEYKMTKTSHLRENSSFYGVDRFDGMLDRIRYGDKTQTENFINELKDLDTFDELDVGIFRDVEGFAYDMGSVVNGEPECCLNFGSPEAKHTLTIYIDLSYSWRASSSDINNRGLAIIKLINTLISKGYIVNVYVFEHSITPYGNFIEKIRINTDILTISTIAYACKCEFFRVVSWLLTAIHMGEKSYEAENTRSEVPNEFIDAIKERGDLYIAGGYGDSRLYGCDKEKAEELVMGYYNDYVGMKEGKDE